MKNKPVPVLRCCFLLHDEHDPPDALPPTTLPTRRNEEEQRKGDDTLFDSVVAAHLLLRPLSLIDDRVCLLSWYHIRLHGDGITLISTRGVR